MKKMTKDEFDLAIANLEDERSRILGKMIDLADEMGFSFSCDVGGGNEYYPEGTKECEACEEGRIAPFVGYKLPDGTVVHDYPLGEKFTFEYGEPYTCGACGGSGRVEVEYSGWQRSYC